MTLGRAHYHSSSPLFKEILAVAPAPIFVFTPGGPRQLLLRVLNA